MLKSVKIPLRQYFLIHISVHRKKSRNSKSKKRRSKRSPSIETNSGDSSSSEKNVSKQKKVKRSEEKKKKVLYFSTYCIFVQSLYFAFTSCTTL